MASETDICNMAMAYLGDDATIASISPPDNSSQSTHCARFYPIARNTLLEMHAWGFATKRQSLALLLEAPPSSWLYVYAAPADALNFLAVIPSDTTDDFGIGRPNNGSSTGITNSSVGIYTPQTYTHEADATGAQIIYTNQVNAVLRYTALVTDPTQFTPLFIEALAWLLASKLAGPVLKGDAGAKMSMECIKQFRYWMSQATMSDANQQRHQTPMQTSWLANR